LRHKAPKNKSSFFLTDGALAEWKASEDFDFVWNYSDHIKKLEVSSGQELLCKIVISSEHRSRLRRQILERGLHEHYLFANLDGLGKYLARTHHEEMAHNVRD
jgi:hypothetical protein